jgi:hypothetical protein
VRGHDDVRALSSSVKLTYDDFVLFPDDADVARATDTIQVYVRESEVFGRPVEFSRGGGDIVMTPLLPGLDIPLVEIFRD